ncbi:hypothetical protein GYMLUDRAFT_51033, partial [Collybiopsis luxurians FD-317 M1]
MEVLPDTFLRYFDFSKLDFATATSIKFSPDSLIAFSFTRVHSILVFIPRFPHQISNPLQTGQTTKTDSSFILS